MSVSTLVQIRATENFKINSTYQRIKDMGEGIKENYIKLKNKYPNFCKTKSPILDKYLKLLTIKETLETRASLKELHKKMRSELKSIDDIKNTINSNLYFIKQSKLITNKFNSVINNLKKINLLEAEKEQLETTSKLKLIFQELKFNKIETKRIKKSSLVIIRAKKLDNTTISIKLSPDGTLEMDFSNVFGEKCKKEMNLILEKLKKHGFEFEVKKIIDHQKYEGHGVTKEVKEIFDLIGIEASFEMTDFNFEIDEENIINEKPHRNFQIQQSKQKK